MRQREEAAAKPEDELAQATTGDGMLTQRQDEFARLAGLHMTAVLRTAAALVGMADAEDAAQEALLRGMRAWPEVRDPAALKTWLLRITYNVCMDWQRGRFGSDRHRTQPLADDATGLSAPLTSDPGASDHAARLDLRQALNQLAPDLRQAVLLRYYVGLDATEIGVAMRLPASTVRSHLRRARVLLRAALDITENPTPTLPRKEEQ